MRWIGYVATILWWSGIARSLSTLNRGHSYKITPKPCKVPGSESKEGTCMFVWECIKSEGTHVGVCVDTFMFGSCCVHNTTVNTIGASHRPHHHHHQQQQQQQQHQQQQQQHGGKTSTLRPSLLLSEPTGNETIRLTSTSLLGFSSTVSSTAKPNLHYFSGSHGFSGASTRPMKPYSHGVGRPLQKRPHAKPTSEHDVDVLQTPAVSSASTNTWAEGRPQETKRPGHHTGHSHHHKTRPDDGTPNDKPSPVLSQPGFKDKETHNTLIVRLPGKEHADDEVVGSSSLSKPNKQGKPGKPGNQRPFESRPDDGKTEDLSVQETINRPNVNSVIESETGKEPHPGLNFVHTERPHWATKPAQSKPSSTDFSKPYFSIKTTTYRPASGKPDHRPNFISRPNWVLTTRTSTTTTVRPTHARQPSTSAAGSVPQTSHWQVTTEPAFVTKQKPSSASSVSSSFSSSLPTSFSSPSSSSSSSSSSMSSSSSLSSSTKPITTITVPETVRIPSSGTSSHFWSNSWTPPRPSLKPHWTDSPSLLLPESPPPRPSLKPTESQQSTEYQKPLGSAHYITTSNLETSTRPRPTKKTTMRSTTPSTLTSSASGTTNPTTATATMTTTSRTTSASSTSATTVSTTTTQRLSTTEVTVSEKATGSVMTVAAADESKNMQCGVPPLFPRAETSPRIVGGKDASFGRWPWQVSVRRTSFFGFSSTHRCGGAVLNENWIATAGHCVDDLLTSQIRIRVGEYDFSSLHEQLAHVESGVAKKVVHPKYNFYTYEYDLALVRLENSLTFDAHISPICLPATDDLLIGENATVTGWGRLSEGGTLPSVLQEVSVPIVSNDRCKSMFLRAGRHEFIPDIFLCAGYETGGQDSCQGDSGGPLQVRGKDGRYFLAGIISWGIGCAEANLPGVCTRISKFVPWILKNVT